MTTRALSSCTTLSGMRCARGAALGEAGGASATRSPPRTSARAAARAPSTVMWPSASQACSRLREYCGNMRASAWSRRSPARARGASALIGATKLASQSVLSSASV